VAGKKFIPAYKCILLHDFLSTWFVTSLKKLIIKIKNYQYIICSLLQTFFSNQAKVGVKKIMSALNTKSNLGYNKFYSSQLIYSRDSITNG